MATKKKTVKAVKIDYEAKYKSLVKTIKAELAKWRVRQKQLENQGTNMAVNVLRNVLPE
jgi:flagellar motility protein MotE (MotC chaperone)